MWEAIRNENNEKQYKLQTEGVLEKDALKLMKQNNAGCSLGSSAEFRVSASCSKSETLGMSNS